MGDYTLGDEGERPGPRPETEPEDGPRPEGLKPLEAGEAKKQYNPCGCKGCGTYVFYNERQRKTCYCKEREELRADKDPDKFDYPDTRNSTEAGVEKMSPDEWFKKDREAGFGFVPLPLQVCVVLHSLPRCPEI